MPYTGSLTAKFETLMRCTIISRAGQALASGRLLIRIQTDGTLRLDLETDRGRILEGGIISEDGDLTAASAALAEQFFAVWGMSDVILNIQCGSGDRAHPGRLPSAQTPLETALL
jgi:hypothetical protein